MDFVDRVKGALARVDGWVNLMTGMGVEGRSKTLRYAPDAVLPPDFLEQLYVGDPYARCICDVVPEEGLRQGYEVRTGDPCEASAIAAVLDARSVDDHLVDAWTWSRVYGGGAIFVGADDGRPPWEPLNESAIRSVNFLTVVDSRELAPVEWYVDRQRGNFGEPSVYVLTRQGTGPATEVGRVHESRLVIFRGGRTSRRRRAALRGWGESELQRIYDVLAKFNTGWESTNTLLAESSQGVFKMKNLMAMMAADKRDLLKTRLEMMDLARSVSRSVLLDSEESYERAEVSALTGVAQVIDKNLLMLAGAARIPVTILMGQSPAGLSATGDSDVRWFYDRTQTAQRIVLRRRHLRVIRLLCLAKNGPTGGRVPEKLAIEYRPLWQLTELEKADLRSKQATTDQVYIGVGVVTADEVAFSRFRPEGWSAETSIDLGDREATAQADRDAAEATKGQGADAPGADHAEGAAGIIAKVAARELPRDGGVALLTASLGMTPEDADRVMGEAGRTFFTAPEPGHAQALADAQGQVAQLTRSRDGVRQILSRVLQRNRDGELVVGRLIAKAPTDAEEGDVLEEGDTIPAEGGGSP